MRLIFEEENEEKRTSLVECHHLDSFNYNKDKVKVQILDVSVDIMVLPFYLESDVESYFKDPTNLISKIDFFKDH